jgi:signal recognition particle receptor subunit beta
VVLADTRRLDDCYDAVEYFDTRGMPFAVAVNGFAGAPRFPEDELRQALQINKTVPLLHCDARQRDEVRQTLVDLVEYVIDRRRVNPRRRPTS